MHCGLPLLPELLIPIDGGLFYKNVQWKDAFQYWRSWKTNSIEYCQLQTYVQLPISPTLIEFVSSLAPDWCHPNHDGENKLLCKGCYLRYHNTDDEHKIGGMNFYLFPSKWCSRIDWMSLARHNPTYQGKMQKFLVEEDRSGSLSYCTDGKATSNWFKPTSTKNHLVSVRTKSS